MSVEQDTTDILMTAVVDVLALVGQSSIVPTKALLAYEYINESGDEKVDYVVSESLGLTTTIGMARLIEADALDDLLDQDDGR